MGRYHPVKPHWYLPLIGVDPLAQGRGYGSALLRDALELIDREGQAAYLESTNPVNLPLYQRHGFEVVGIIRVGDAPPVIPMMRPAR
jgi:ribosomal protein S18 acetylase RimI-like enzyme